MAEFVTGFNTSEGVKKYDYNSLGNKPDSFSNALKGSARGDIIRVDDVSPNVHEIACKVKSKNLFDTQTNYKNGEYTYENGTLTLSIRYIHKFIKLVAGRTYTFSCHSTRTGTDGGGVYIRAYTEDQAKYVDIPGGNYINTLSPVTTVTLPEGYPYIRLAFYGYFAADGSGTSTYTDIMLEEGTVATGYVPYISPAAVSVTRYGKNLLDLSQAILTSATYNEGANGVTCNISNSYYAGARINYLNDFLLANKGKTITFSIGDAIDGALISLLIYGTRTSGKTNQEGSATGKREISFLISEEFTEITGLEVRANRQTAAFTDTATIIRNMQIEVSETATEFEKFNNSAVYVPSEDGTVEGVLSLSPTMTLLTDTENTMVEVEYQRDINILTKTVPLIDRVTGIPYYLYVSDGKLQIEEREV